MVIGVCLKRAPLNMAAAHVCAGRSCECVGDTSLVQCCRELKLAVQFTDCIYAAFEESFEILFKLVVNSLIDIVMLMCW